MDCWLAASEASSAHAGIGHARVWSRGVEFATTDAEGEFSFAEVPAGTASISIVVPIGYLAATPANATADIVVISGQVVTQNFALQTLPDAGPVREANYWKQ